MPESSPPGQAFSFGPVTSPAAMWSEGFVDLFKRFFTMLTPLASLASSASMGGIDAG